MPIVKGIGRKKKKRKLAPAAPEPNPGVWKYEPIPPANGVVRSNAPDRKYEPRPSKVQGQGGPWEAAPARAQWPPPAVCDLRAIFFGGGGNSPGIVLETAALRCCPRAVAVYCGDAHTIARAVRVRMGERAIASIWHYKDKRKQTQKGAGCWLMTTTARASSHADRALRNVETRGVGSVF